MKPHKPTSRKLGDQERMQYYIKLMKERNKQTNEQTTTTTQTANQLSISSKTVLRK